MVYLLIPVGLLVGLLLPRGRHASLVALAWLVSAAALFQATLTIGPLSERLPIWGAAVAFAVVPAIAALLARALPRASLPVLTFLTFSFGLRATLEVDWARPPWTWIFLGVTIAVAALSAISVPLGVRLLSACVAAPLVLFPFGARLWHRPFFFATVAAFFVLSAALTPRRRMVSPRTGPLLAALLVAAVGIGALVIALPSLAARPAGPADAVHAERLAKVRARAPEGGLLWKTPTEELTFEGHSAMPWFESLDAQYLFGQQALLIAVPGTTVDGRFVLDDEVDRLRAVKAPEEIALLQAAARATVDSLRELLPRYQAGAKEADLARELEARFLQHGCDSVSFPLIVATGPGAAKPHQFALDQTLQDGELVVTDIGCYRDHYASDFTRTLPVGGKFTPQMRQRYDAVYAAQQAAVAACGPGAVLSGRRRTGVAPDGGTSPSLEQITRATLKAQGVDPDYPHGVGHSVGLYVHDSGRAKLEPGMVITIEPGLYQEGSFGIRIEDTYLVTDAGCVPLTSGFPASSADVERMMAGQPPLGSEGGVAAMGGSTAGVPDGGLRAPDGGH